MLRGVGFEPTYLDHESSELAFLLYPRTFGTARLELALSAPKAEVLPFTLRPTGNSGGQAYAPKNRVELLSSILEIDVLPLNYFGGDPPGGVAYPGGQP